MARRLRAEAFTASEPCVRTRTTAVPASVARARRAAAGCAPTRAATTSTAQTERAATAARASGRASTIASARPGKAAKNSTPSVSIEYGGRAAPGSRSRAFRASRAIRELPTTIRATRDDFVDTGKAIAALELEQWAATTDVGWQRRAAVRFGGTFAVPAGLNAGLAIVEARAGVANAVALVLSAVTAAQIRSIFDVTGGAGGRLLLGARWEITPFAACLELHPAAVFANEKQAARKVRRRAVAALCITGAGAALSRWRRRARRGAAHRFGVTAARSAEKDPDCREWPNEST